MLAIQDKDPSLGRQAGLYRIAFDICNYTIDLMLIDD